MVELTSRVATMSQSIGNASVPVVAPVDSATPSPVIPGLDSGPASGSSTPPSTTVPSPSSAPAAAPAASVPGPVRTARRHRHRRRANRPRPPHVPGQWAEYRWTDAGRRGEGLVPGTEGHSRWLWACEVLRLREELCGEGMCARIDRDIAELWREAAAVGPVRGFFAQVPGKMEVDEERFNAEWRALAAGAAADPGPVWDPRNNTSGYHAEDLGDPFV